MQTIAASRFKGVIGGEDQRVALLFDTDDAGEVAVVLAAEQAFETLMTCLPSFNDAAFRGKSYRAQLMATALQWVAPQGPASPPVLRVYLGGHADNRLEIGVPAPLLAPLAEATQQFVRQQAPPRPA